MLADKRLGLVEIECERHVILRVGDITQFVELRFESTRCVSAGRATVQTRQLVDAAKTFGKGTLTMRKTSGEARVVIRAGEREVSMPAQSYTPADFPGGRSPVMSVGGDVLADLLARTTYAMAGPKKPALAVLHLEVKDGRLAFIASDGLRLAAASVAAPAGAAPLHNLNIGASTAERLTALVAEAVRLARPRGRGAGSRGAPMMQLQVPSQVDTRALIVRTELFTFAAAEAADKYPAYEKVVPAADTFDGVSVVSARALQEALKPNAKGEVSLEFSATLVVRNVPDDGTPAISTTIRDVFVDGPSRRIRLRTAYLLSATEAIAGANAYLCLATASDSKSAVVVVRWQPATLPKGRRDVLAVVREALDTRNFALVMPIA